MRDSEQGWRVLTENREAVIEQLKQGRCDGLRPAARGVLDGFAAFPERRAPIERKRSRSPYILRKLGFNARQIMEGFYDTWEAERPFTAQTIADSSAKAETDDFLEDQKGVLVALAHHRPGRRHRDLQRQRDAPS